MSVDYWGLLTDDLLSYMFSYFIAMAPKGKIQQIEYTDGEGRAVIAYGPICSILKLRALGNRRVRNVATDLHIRQQINIFELRMQRIQKAIELHPVQVQEMADNLLGYTDAFVDIRNEFTSLIKSMLRCNRLERYLMSDHRLDEDTRAYFLQSCNRHAELRITHYLRWDLKTGADRVAKYLMNPSYKLSKVLTTGLIQFQTVHIDPSLDPFVCNVIRESFPDYQPKSFYRVRGVGEYNVMMPDAEQVDRTLANYQGLGPIQQHHGPNYGLEDELMDYSIDADSPEAMADRHLYN